MDALGVELLNSSQTFRQVTRQAVQPRDHDDVTGLELLPELLPRGTAHGPARGHVGEDAVVPEPVVGEDAALGGQPARALRLGYPDVAEYPWVHVATSPHGNQTPVCLPLTVHQCIRSWAGWQSTTGENVRLEKTVGRGLIAREGYGHRNPILTPSPGDR